jgi:hypothetical protein
VEGSTWVWEMVALPGGGGGRGGGAVAVVIAYREDLVP